MLAGDFGRVLRAVVATIDQHGLKHRHLAKHKPDVDRFFKSVEGLVLRSEVAEGYRKRLLKCQGTLFRFIDHDGVPWNNNNAEHAVKQFAYYREIADGLLTEAGLNQYLVLLSISLTCKYKGVTFLKFLLSQGYGYRPVLPESRQEETNAWHRTSTGRLHVAPPKAETRLGARNARW